jgi:hypothetical protein
MFLPKSIENKIAPSSLMGKAAFAFVLAAAVLGGAFVLRSYTVRHLTLWTGEKNIAAVAILPEDGFKMDHRMADILGLAEVKKRLDGNKQYLIYFLPQDYVMQGMIGDTGESWKLYEQHHAFSMIADWIFNPFGHLRGGHHAMHGGMQHGPAGPGDGVVRRLIFLSIEGVDARSAADLFAINAVRVPQFMLDVDVHSLNLLEIKDLPHGSGWGSVPTPLF